jgi:membrane associated rhomboid family serine protease
MKKYKDVLLVVGVVLVAFIAMGGDGLADLANKKFWWSFWSVANVVAIIACFGGWFYLWKQDRAAAKAEYEASKK